MELNRKVDGMRQIHWEILVLVAAIWNAGAIAQASGISLVLTGSTDSTSFNFVDNTTSWDITLPAATLTPLVEFLPNNVGLVLGITEIHFSGVSQTGLMLDTPNFVSIPSLLDFTTPAGEFQFDSFANGVEMVPPNDFTDGTITWVFPGVVRGGGLDPTFGALYLYFNPDGSYGNVPWILVALGVPEPSTIVLAGLGLCGLAWQIRRRN